MTRKITRQIVGYDPATETAEFEHYIPLDKWRDVLSLIQKDKDDPDTVYNYPLDISLANDIMGMIGCKASQELKYYLEIESID